MSKLAAICAKLQGGAVAMKDNTSSLFNSPQENNQQPIFPLPTTQDTADTDDEPLQMSLSQSPVNLPTTVVSTDDDDAPPDYAIGVLKRKSIMSSTGGSSRRKKQRPAASTTHDDDDSALNTDWVVSNADDSKSVDGSEHSLHIDLAEEQGKTPTCTSDITRTRNPFQQYAQSTPSAIAPNPAVLQALGLSAGFPSSFGSIMASQSLAALAQQASNYKAEQQNNSGVASPASLSGDSLNDSHGRTSMTEKLGSEKGGKQKKPLDHSKYLARYSNAQECGSSYCSGMNYREHFHCLDCPSRIIVKKEEMIRHYKWHKKREDSLQHGFMRYSPFDDCIVKFGPCAHNKKQTHYHCIQTGCNKVYVSTSDVQMHANYHRKASAIIMEGFQRFRATEDCGTPNCDFYSQRTTHFHCRRPACNFTFKNKADMEKHKTYHQKDEILAKDGFKKYMKYEHCPYNGCAYSKLSNHIHCMRPGCQYVLHSTSQLYPHKRKHEKKDTEPITYSPEVMQQNLNGAASVAQYSSPSTPTTDTVEAQKILPLVSGSLASATAASDLLSTVAKLSQSLMMPGLKEGKTPPMNPFIPNSPMPKPPQLTPANIEAVATVSNDDEATSDSASATSTEQIFDKSLNLTPGRVLEPAAMNWKTEKSSRLNNQAKSMMGHFNFKVSSGNYGDPGASPVPAMLGKGSVSAEKETSNKNGEKQSELWKKYLTRYTANDPCNPRCWLLYKDHYHCNVERCFNAFKNKDGVRDHARLHDNQEKISEQLFTGCEEGQKCTVEGCQYSVTTSHFHCKWMGCTKTIPLDEDIFARLDHFQEHEFTSRINQTTARRSSNVSSSAKSVNKKRGRPPKTSSAFPGMFPEEAGYAEHQQQDIQPKHQNASYSKFDENNPCYDDLCKFKLETHYHCNSQRCHNTTNRLDVMRAHSVNFHSYIQIPENYAYFDRNVNCRGVHCSNNRNSCHYHCLRPGCEHSFIRHTTVVQHDKRHLEDAVNTKGGTAKTLVKREWPTSTDYTGAESPLAAGGESIGQRGLALANEFHNMAEAAKIQQEMMMRRLDRGDEPLNLGALANINNSNKTVKAAGTFFPQAGKADVSVDGERHDDSSDVSSSAGEPSSDLPGAVGTPSVPSNNPTAVDGVGQQNTQATAMLNMLTQMLLLHQKAVSVNQLQQPQQQLHPQPGIQPQQDQEEGSAATSQEATWQKMLGRMYASPEVPCGNVFCKKKQIEHYHCLDCGTAFNKSNETRLRIHMSKHNKYAGKLGIGATVADIPSPNDVVVGSAANQTTGALQQVPSCPPRPGSSDTLAGMNSYFMEAMAAHQQNGRKNLSDAVAAGESSASLMNTGIPDSSTNNPPAASASSTNIQEMMMKALQLQMISNGNRNSDAASSTRGNNRAVSQSDREEGESSAADSAADDEGAATTQFKEYKRYSKGVDCGYSKCLHKLSDHYHCLREECTYSVIEEARLPQHTKRHEKLDKIMGEDFKLYKQRNDCGRADCEFSSKASHFHCLLCPYICTDANRIMPHRKNHGVAPSNNQNNQSNTSMYGATGESP